MYNVVFGKTMVNVRKHRDTNLSQQKEEETIWCQNQIIILQSFLQKFISNRNEKSRDTYEYTRPFRTFNTRIK